MSFAAEPYGVFVDDLVSSLTGGVTREEFAFIPENAPFRVGFPTDVLAATVRVHGLVEGEFFRFRPDQDYEVTADGAIAWLEGDPGVPRAGARWPDLGTRFYASYERKPEVRSTPALTDRNPGSVLRTLAESFAREYAVLSKQLDRVYDAAFLSTAEGRDLEQVAALVGVARRRRTFAVGEVVFARTTPAPADIFIPEGTLISTGEAPPITVEVIENRTLRAGTVSVAAPVQSLVSGPDGVAIARALTVIHRPILGVDSVANQETMTFGGGEESDEALRRRAARALEAGGRATASALVGALLQIEGIREQDVRIVEDHIASPGTVKLTIAADLDASKAQRAAELITEYRPAGIRVLHNLNVPPPASLPPSGDAGGADAGPLPPASEEPVGDETRFPVGVKAVVTPASASLTPTQKATLKAGVEEELRAVLAKYGIGEAVIYNALVAAVMQVDGVADVSLDLYRDDGRPPTGRTNLLADPPDTRAELETLTVSLRGAMIALDVGVTVQRVGVVSEGLPLRQFLAEARDDIASRLATFANGPTRPSTVTASVLKDALPATDRYSVLELSYAAEFLDDGLRIVASDIEITLDPEQQLWIRAVNVAEGVTTS